MSAAGPIPAVVLAGGRSARLGQPKAWLPTAEGPLARALGLRAAAAGCDPVWIVVAEAKDLGLGALPLHALLEGPRPHRHPLFGLAAALSGLRAPLVLCLPCDLPFLGVAELAALRAVAGPVRAMGPRGPEPLLGVFSADIAAEARALAAAEAPCRALAPGMPTLRLPDAALQNLNRPADLDALLPPR
ncbi:MAG: NTP transferase domain-containing protein [Deltaproteobacteria bacterium]|nr:NTP transferase domain-containing protein [Deltaproteobacteria bacterium]